MATTNMVRVATVKATGARYLVDRMHFGKGLTDPDKVYCWGEVTRVEQVRGGAVRSTHDGGVCKTFLASAVVVAEVPRTFELLGAMFQQRVSGLEAKGHVIESRTGRTGRTTVRDYGTPAQIAARAEASARIVATFEESGLADALRAALRPGRAY